MAEKKEVARAESSEVEPRREQEIFVRPPVDVYEDQAGIVLYADLPGVTKENLIVRMDGDTLLIEGRAQLETPSGMEAVYAEFRAPNFRRSFSLSTELETGKIDASLRNGVLTLRIPKQEASKPRKIEVRAG
jgi:HSP20 family molecular chaperone IbpA